jgi:hypothetical protein
MGLRDWLRHRGDEQSDVLPPHRRDRHVPPPPPVRTPAPQPARPAPQPTHLEGPAFLDPRNAPPDLQRKWEEVRRRKRQSMPPQPEHRRQQPGRG